jgi:hypothetical protein
VLRDLAAGTPQSDMEKLLRRMFRLDDEGEEK